MLLQPVDRRPLNVTGWSRFDKQAMTLGLDQETKYEHMSSLFIHHISLNQSGQFIYFLVRFHISQSNLQLVIWGFFVQNERDLAALIWSPIKVRFTLSELSHSLFLPLLKHTWRTQRGLQAHMSYSLITYSTRWQQLFCVWVWLPIACVMCLRAAELSEPGLVMQ